MLGKRPVIAAALSDADAGLLTAADLRVIDLLELRVDLFRSLSETYVQDVFSRVKKRFRKPVLCTIRSTAEGGGRSMDENKRYALFRALIPLADMADIEVRSRLFKDIIRLSHKCKKPVIASYHNFTLTPTDTFFLSMLAKARQGPADIIKLAVRARNREDVARLTCFTMEHRRNNLITISLGKQGRASRLINPFFGSLVTYGYVGKPKADGQMHVQELAGQLEILYPPRSQ